jgi:hypothetical protein
MQTSLVLAGVFLCQETQRRSFFAPPDSVHFAAANFAGFLFRRAVTASRSSSRANRVKLGLPSATAIPISSSRKAVGTGMFMLLSSFPGLRVLRRGTSLILLPVRPAFVALHPAAQEPNHLLIERTVLAQRDRFELGPQLRGRVNARRHDLPIAHLPTYTIHNF